MNPLLSPEQIRMADAQCIAQEGITSTELMERASKACVKHILELHSAGHFGNPTKLAYVVFMGMGNNGGDGAAIARLLHAACLPVRVLRVLHRPHASPDCALNHQRLAELGVPCSDLSSTDHRFALDDHEVVIDAMLGAGLSEPVHGWLAEIIEAVNVSHRPVIAIDMPSGLFMGANNGPDGGAVISALITLTFEVPKLALLLSDNAAYVGLWQLVDIGLDKAYFRSLPAMHALVEEADVRNMLSARPRFAHKGTFGHALLVAGSRGKMGAAVLATRAALRSGVGLVTAQVPADGHVVLQSTCPEAMCSLDRDAYHLTELPSLDPYNAVGMGPGIGQHGDTERVVKNLIQQTSVPIVLDADALNILAGQPTWMAFLPASTLLTPHPKEFDRLFGSPARSGAERLERAIQQAARWNAVVVLKGAFTAICAPDGRVFFNPTGGPGMAKGGSGDVLTGLLTGLLAQGFTCLEAAILGVYVHGLAGDLAAAHKGSDGMTAMDIAESIPEAWKNLRNASEEAVD
ncbi:MAG: NAD(P)H-hydrate dehydratase [Flavobacteriales bacterium]|nr:NAD(P)H-hydrate dehydratase [Flavobacteriales bacterium]